VQLPVAAVVVDPPETQPPPHSRQPPAAVAELAVAVAVALLAVVAVALPLAVTRRLAVGSPQRQRRPQLQPPIAPSTVQIHRSVDADILAIWL